MATKLEQLLGKTSGNAWLDKKVAKAEREAMGGAPAPVAAPQKGDLTQSEFGNAKPLTPAQKTESQQKRDALLRARDAEYKKGGWIAGAIKKPGALRAQLGVKAGEKIPAKKLNAAAKASGKLGQRARLAKTFKGFK